MQLLRSLLLLLSLSLAQEAPKSFAAAKTYLAELHEAIGHFETLA